MRMTMFLLVMLCFLPSVSMASWGSSETPMQSLEKQCTNDAIAEKLGTVSLVASYAKPLDKVVAFITICEKLGLRKKPKDEFVQNSDCAKKPKDKVE